MQATYEIDPVHSHVQFSIRHMMISNVRGMFKGVKGTVAYDSENPAATNIHADIDTSTINTHDSDRDAHLKSAEFLDAAQFPVMTFQSRTVKPTDDGLDVAGDLSLHGVTKPVNLQVFDITPEAKDPWGNTRIGASAKAKLKRSDFGLTWNAALETGGVLVGDELKLEFEVELIRK